MWRVALIVALILHACAPSQAPLRGETSDRSLATADRMFSFRLMSLRLPTALDRLRDTRMGPETGQASLAAVRRRLAARDGTQTADGAMSTRRGTKNMTMRPSALRVEGVSRVREAVAAAQASYAGSESGSDYESTPVQPYAAVSPGHIVDLTPHRHSNQSPHSWGRQTSPATPRCSSAQEVIAWARKHTADDSPSASRAGRLPLPAIVVTDDEMTPQTVRLSAPATPDAEPQYPRLIPSPSQIVAPAPSPVPSKAVFHGRRRNTPLAGLDRNTH